LYGAATCGFGKIIMVEDLSLLTSRAFKELDATKSELLEKEKLLNHLSFESLEKIKELSKINHDLQDKVGFCSILVLP